MLFPKVYYELYVYFAVLLQITVADIFLYTVTDFISVLFPETRSVNEWCKGWIANMEADEKFSEYLRSRPPAGIHLT